MKSLSAKLLLAAATVTVSSAYAASPIDVSLKNAKGEDVGTASLTETPNGVRVKLSVKNLTPGEHAMHFHETGSCVGPKFESAGAHFAPKNKAHGKVKGGPHEGDMPNFTVGADGTGTAEVVNSGVRLDKGEASLLKTGGTALVIHAKADDHKTQPSGDAGDRLACGEVMNLVTK